MSFVGQPIPRVDGPRKVTGAAQYAIELVPDGLLYGEVVQSRIALGRIVAIDSTEAEKISGVLMVLTHANAPRMAWQQNAQIVDPATGEPEWPLKSDQVVHQQQHIALVIAETPEAARAGADLVRVDYAPDHARIAIADAVRHAILVHGEQEAVQPGHYRRGDPDTAFAHGAASIDETYIQPRENQNPMEPHATIAAWDGDRLTLWDKTQWTQNCAKTVAMAFGIDPAQVRVICPFVGGAFGSSLRVWPQTYLAAMAARVIGRPVRIELSRRQYYGGTGARPWTQQRVRLAADRQGRLTALFQEAIGETSMYEDYIEATLRPVRMLYDIDNCETLYKMAKRAVNTPNAMRAPGECTGLYALECAIDELAAKLGIDPVTLRLRNIPTRDRFADLPFTTNSLAECLRQGADRFNWSERSPVPRGMARGRMLRGMGVAAGAYPTNILAAEARARLETDGTVHVSLAASDMGPGTWTSLTQIAADSLGVPIEQVQLHIGDSDLPKAPVHGGSMTLASNGHAVRDACLKLAEIARRQLGVNDLAHAGGRITAPIEAHGAHDPGDLSKNFSPWAFGAIFTEVLVDPATFETRVVRASGTYGNGHIINPMLARSQSIGGIMMGIGQALMERTEIDDRTGRIVNANLAEYLVPVMADCPEVDVVFVREDDPALGPLQAKGLGEIALCGIAPAIANAVWHATGIRVRELPITPDRLLLSAD